MSESSILYLWESMTIVHKVDEVSMRDEEHWIAEFQRFTDTTEQRTEFTQRLLRVWTVGPIFMPIRTVIAEKVGTAAQQHNEQGNIMMLNVDHVARTKTVKQMAGNCLFIRPSYYMFQEGAIGLYTQFNEYSIMYIYVLFDRYSYSTCTTWIVHLSKALRRQNEWPLFGTDVRMTWLMTL